MKYICFVNSDRRKGNLAKQLGFINSVNADTPSTPRDNLNIFTIKYF